MNAFEIKLGYSAGNINFGISRDDARKLLGEYREFKDPIIDVNSFDQFNFCQLGYDGNDKVEFICFDIREGVVLKLNNKTISGMTALRLLAFIKELDPAVEIEKGGGAFESNTLGLAAYFECEPVTLLSTEEETIAEVLKTISVATKGYWNKYR